MLVSQTPFGGETNGSVDKCRLFSQATIKRIWLNFVGMVDGGWEYNKELLGGDVPLGNKKP